MAYSVLFAAEELMLDPADIREIFAAFFEDATPLLQEGKLALQSGNRQLLSRKMHALKGSALNLRMEALGNLALQAEKNEKLSAAELNEILWSIQMELEQVAASVSAYYAK